MYELLLSQRALSRQWRLVYARYSLAGGSGQKDDFEALSRTVNGEFFIVALRDGKESFTVRDEADIFRFGIEESPSISREGWPPESGSISRHRELPA